MEWTESALIEYVVNRNEIIPSLKDVTIERLTSRARKIYAYLVKRENRTEERCDCCVNKNADKRFSAEVYEAPWDVNTTEFNFCSDECREAYLYEGDFSYFTCDVCGREICEQCKSNGWHIHYRDDEVTGGRICLRCYEEDAMANGLARGTFEEGTLAGMFINEDDLTSNGWQVVEEYESYFVNGKDSAKGYCDVALEYIDKGYKVMTGYSRLGLGGGEGYVTMLIKKNRKKRKVV
jgi:hypothetical protein